MKTRLKEIEKRALAEIASSQADKNTLEALKTKYLGRKGELTELFKKIGEVSAEEKPEIGKLINFVKDRITGELDKRSGTVSGEEEDPGEKIDVTLPGVSSKPGHLHPITQTIRDVCNVFVSHGFRIVEGPEIETPVSYTHLTLPTNREV